jgi:hypothetical protein
LIRPKKLPRFFFLSVVDDPAGLSALLLLDVGLAGVEGAGIFSLAGVDGVFASVVTLATPLVTTGSV